MAQIVPSVCPFALEKWITAYSPAKGRIQRTPRAAKGVSAKTNRHSHQQPQQPLAKLKRRHGKPSPARTHGDHGGIVDSQEPGRGLIENVQREGDGQRKPWPAKTDCGPGSFHLPDGPPRLIVNPRLPISKENHEVETRRSEVGSLRSDFLYFLTSLINPIKFPSESRKNTIHKS